jgi:hypothetical protein
MEKIFKQKSLHNPIFANGGKFTADFVVTGGAT